MAIRCGQTLGGRVLGGGNICLVDIRDKLSDYPGMSEIQPRLVAVFPLFPMNTHYHHAAFHGIVVDKTVDGRMRPIPDNLNALGQISIRGLEFIVVDHETRWLV